MIGRPRRLLARRNGRSLGFFAAAAAGVAGGCGTTAPASPTPARGDAAAEVRAAETAVARSMAERDLQDAGAELVLSGHDHLYERFAPIDAQALLCNRHVVFWLEAVAVTAFSVHWIFKGLACDSGLSWLPWRLPRDGA